MKSKKVKCDSNCKFCKNKLCSKKKIKIKNGRCNRYPNSVSTCFHCGGNSVIWSGDFSFEDYGIEGEGIIHILTCSDCSCEIEYKVPLNCE